DVSTWTRLRRRPPWIAGLTLVGVGIAALGAATGAGVLAAQDAAQLMAAQGSWSGAPQDRYAEGRSAALAADALLAVGGVLIGIGVATAPLAARARLPKRAVLSPARDALVFAWAF